MLVAFCTAGGLARWGFFRTSVRSSSSPAECWQALKCLDWTVTDSHWHLCRRLESAEHGLASWSLGTHSCCVPSPFIACGFPLTKAFWPHEGWTGRHSGPKRTVSSFTQERAQQLSCCHVEQLVISPSVSESTCHRKAFVCVYDFCTLMMLDLSHCCRSPGVRMDKTFRRSSSLPWCVELIHFHFYCFFPRSNCIPCI